MRLRKPKSSSGIMKDDKQIILKYPKPKILLIDIKDDSEARLKEAGYNVSAGTFGVPYLVPKSDQYLPLNFKPNLPNHSEQEIIIIDLVTDKPLKESHQIREITEGVNDWWSKCDKGIIDTRPLSMLMVQKDFNRILAHGGIFVVFTDEKFTSEYILGQQKYGQFHQEDNIKSNNWKFLSLLDENIRVEPDSGTEINVIDSKHSLPSLIRKHTRSGKFNCILHWYGFTTNWITLAKSKYDSPVAGIINTNDIKKGFIFLLPQIENRSSFLIPFIREILPDFCPHLFPHVEGAKWVEREVYEIPDILDLKTHIVSVQDEARKKIVEFEKEIKSKRDEYGFLHDLITSTDKRLVDAVKKSLSILGFNKIIDVDEEREKQGDKWKDEDILIVDYSPFLLLEIKGIGGKPSDDDALEVGKYVAPRQKELKRVDIQCLSIINHQRHIPALERDNDNTFRDLVVTSAEKREIGLLTTWDLYRLVRSYLRNKWNHEQVRDIFYKVGRITPLPNHYKLIGSLEEYWEKAGALSITLTYGDIKIGDRIAYELPVEFVEEEITSIQIEDEPVTEASLGSVIGIKTLLSKEQARKVVKVYRVEIN